jgi:ArsR family transcriptional regulator, lead/cadmium/zinc/bismuth-responsive transcriptional repressor
VTHPFDPACAELDHAPAAGRTAAVNAAALDRAARLFRAIGDVPRLRLLALLSHGEMCVTELAAAEGEGLSTISQRLRVLRSENIVARRRLGKHIIYALADQHVKDLVINALAHSSEQPPAGGAIRISSEETEHGRA